MKVKKIAGVILITVGVILVVTPIVSGVPLIAAGMLLMGKKLGIKKYKAKLHDLFTRTYRFLIQ